VRVNWDWNGNCGGVNGVMRVVMRGREIGDEEQGRGQ
jgi:hypothetical protein